MKKLNLESLVVESFATTPVSPACGTVMGAEDTYDAGCTSTCVTVAPACAATNGMAGNTCAVICIPSEGGCSGAITCNQQSCLGQCNTSGQCTTTQAPMQTCDNYIYSCADTCQW